MNIAGKHTSGLNFIDAHAMAPWATERDVWDVRFNHVRDHLPGQRSTYERAWHRLAQNRDQQGYPNSAAFVNEIWEGEFSLLLCETDGRTIKEIDGWLPSVRGLERCKSARLFEGDWRKRFDRELPNPIEVNLPADALTLVSFDPDRYDRHQEQYGKSGYKRRLYPQDIERTLRAMSSLEGGILIQLSTYATSGDNPQEDVVASVNAIMERRRFRRYAIVKANNRMMSLAYGRDVPWWTELKDLGDCFNEWLKKSKSPI